MGTQGTVYDSDNDSGDSLFDHDETVATLPLSAVPRGAQPTQATYQTQPTLPLDSTSAHNAVRPRDTSPSVQVAASSPAQTPVRGPSAPPSARATLNNGLASAMAPPGTSYRPPVAYNQSQQTQRQPTQNTQQYTQDALSISDSSDDERAGDIVPSVFSHEPRSLASGPSRVQESPQSTKDAFKKLTSSYLWTGGSPQKKRPSPADSHDDNVNGKRKVPRQTGPAIAKPVAPEVPMSLDDMDWELRKKVETMLGVLPHHSIRKLHEALVKKRGNVGDAFDYIAQLQSEADELEQKSQQNQSIDLTQSDDELAASAQKPGVKRDVGHSKSIASKWSSTQAPSKQNHNVQSRPIREKYASSPQTPRPETKPRGRIIRGRRPHSSSPPPAQSPVAKTNGADSPARRPKVFESEDDSDADSGVGSEDDVHSKALEEKLLDFINTASTAALIDLSGQSKEIVDKVLEERPYGSLDAIRGVSVELQSKTKKGNTKTTKKHVGDRLVDSALEMWEGYETVDMLVAKCKSLGEPIATEMKQWGFDAFGAAAANGELELVDVEAASAHDSGIGTPSSSVDDEDVQKARRKRRPLLQQPKCMSSDLVMKDYQVAGLNWLALLYSHKLSGILADDMGLGKTCQVIAFLAHLFENDITKGPHLVVVPGSTLENWLREFKNFCPALKVEPYYGGHLERPEMQYRLLDEIDTINVIVTTYDLAAKPNDAKFLRKVKPVVCVYDEGHGLKNSQSTKYKQLMGIPAQYRLLLTGTPLQNNLQELISLLAFIMPDMFAEHKDELNVIFKARARLSGSDDAHEALLSQERISRARSMMTPFILRRKKHQVLKSLPKKTSRVEYCNLPPGQRELYASIEEQARGILTKTHTSNDSSATANVIMDLRKAAIHPMLFRRLYTDADLTRMTKAYVKRNAGKTEECVYEDMTIMDDLELHNMCLDKSTDYLNRFALEGTPWMDSAKVTALLSLLADYKAGGHRTLVFSQFTRVLNILELVFETAGIPFYRLDGQTPMHERQDLIDSFHGDTTTDVFMLSTKAGGQGINLACADRVVIFDSGFNPHDDAQAENRAHRVGQQRAVDVVRLVCRDTVEESILALGDSKLALDDRVAGQTDAVDKAVENKGIGLVTQMLKSGFEDRREPAAADMPDRTKADGQPEDVSKAFMSGLKKAGLNMSGAAKEGYKGR